jgi:hypothetical protein
MEVLDHLVYATPDLDGTVAALEEQLGVRAAAGGRHPGRGTRNALFGLSGRSYLEVIGPDREEPKPSGPRWFAIDELRAPRLVAWSVRDARLEDRARTAGEAGMALGSIGTGSRVRPDGQLLRWRFTDPATLAAGGVIPFFMDWGEGAHPTDLLPKELRLAELRLEHPQAEAVSRLLRSLEVPAQVHAGPSPRIGAVIEGPRGRTTL